MADIKNPPAFAHGDHVNGGNEGMSLRDYFAGQALLCAHRAANDQWQINKENKESNVARIAYEIADAMLAERAKK